MAINNLAGIMIETRAGDGDATDALVNSVCPPR